MHGHSLGNDHIVNEEVDYMGGVIDNGVEIGFQFYLHRTALEKAQAELRREYDVQEKKRRELEFLEKGCDPLDFKLGNAASISVQSTSLTDQPIDQLVTSEAKGSFAISPSSLRDSVESSDTPDARIVSEPNCADNLLLFDGTNDSVDGGETSLRTKSAPLELTSSLDTGQNAQESGGSAVLGLPKTRAYKRRNRSRPNRRGARSSSNNVLLSRGDDVSSLPYSSGQPDVKGSVVDTGNQQNYNTYSNCNSKPTISTGTTATTDTPPNGLVDMVLDDGQAVESSNILVDMVLDDGQAVESNGLTEVRLPKLVQDCGKKFTGSQKSEGAAEDPPAVASEISESVDGRHLAVSSFLLCPSGSEKPSNHGVSSQQNGFHDENSNGGRVSNESKNCSTTLTRMELDMVSECTHVSLSLDPTDDSVPSKGLRNEDLDRNTREENINYSVSPKFDSDDKLNEERESKAGDRYSLAQDEKNSTCKSYHKDSNLGLEAMKVDGITGSETEKEADYLDPGNEVSSSKLGVSTDKSANDIPSIEKENAQNKLQDPSSPSFLTQATSPPIASSSKLGVSTDKSANDIPSIEKENAQNKLQDPSSPSLLTQATSPPISSSDTNKLNVSTDIQLKLEARAREDSILKEARIIEAKRKRISQLCVRACTSENLQKSDWDFVLEEMAWLANDFAQERVWKISAASQLSHRIASTSRDRLAEKNLLWIQKRIAQTLSKAIMEFWHSVQKLSEGTTIQCSVRNSGRGVQEYAMRYAKCNTFIPYCLAEAPATPQLLFDLGADEPSSNKHLTEENLFYTVPPGAMEMYRKDIESHLELVEKSGSSTQEEVETSNYDAAAGNASEENEGETNTYPLPGDVESGKPSKSVQGKRILMKSSSARSYDIGTASPSMQQTENRFGTQRLILKRPARNIDSIPTKRIRTASKPRFNTPFAAGTSGGTQVSKTIESSCSDTNSLQDDRSISQGESPILNKMEVESKADSVIQLPYDSIEVTKPKKAKHLDSTHDQRWQLENNFQNEMGGYSRKRFDKVVKSNGSSGLSGQHIVKKQKTVKQPVDRSIDNNNPLVRPVPSSVTSHMSTMSNPNELMKIFSGRGLRGRQSKSLKVLVRPTGPGSPWSLFEEQALLVLVHDLGPNWELISDAINNILQYKCILREPKECREHHKEIMSKTAGDGVDNAEDSGSSQSYSYTLPGIKKGGARALFHWLQEPIEENMMRFHFENIIEMSKKQHYLKRMNENQEQELIQPDSSHALALSKLPNYINGGPVLTPLDLCNTPDPTPDAHSGGYQGIHSGDSSIQGSPIMVQGYNFPLSTSPNSSMRYGRNGGQRSASLSVDEHQRGHQYNQMIPRRVSRTPLGTDRGGRMMAGGNRMGMASGISRKMSVVEPAFPGFVSPSMLNSGSMVPPNMAAMAGPANVHSGVGAGPGNSLLRQDSVDMIQPGEISENQRQMKVPDLQVQATQGNTQGAPAYVGLSGGFINQTSPQQFLVHNNLYPPHLQGRNHVSSNQHQAYVYRVGEERQLQLRQQRLLQQQQLAASSGMMPRGPPQPLDSLQNSSSIQPQTESMWAPLKPIPSLAPSMSQHELKTHVPPKGLANNLQPGGNQMMSTMQVRGLSPQASNKSLALQQKVDSTKAAASCRKGQMLPSHLSNSNQMHASSLTAKALTTSHLGDYISVTSSNSQLQQPIQKLPNSSQTQLQPVLELSRENFNSLTSKSLADKDQAQLHPMVSSSSSSCQLGTTAVSHHPSAGQVRTKHVVSSTSSSHWNAEEQMQSYILPKPGARPLTCLSGSRGQGSGEGKPSATLPNQVLDTGTQRQNPQSQRQMSSLQPLQKQQSLPAQQLQAGNRNFYANTRSAYSRLE